MRAARIVAMSALVCASVLIVATARARAVTEYCPAQVLEMKPIDASSTGASSVWGYAISALSPRSVRGTVTVQMASNHWYAFDFPALTLSELPGHRLGAFSDSISPVQYVRFPQPVHVTHFWVSAATASGDVVFGWDRAGRVTCSPPAGPLFLISGFPEIQPVVQPASNDVSAAVPTSAPPVASTACATPFTLPSLLRVIDYNQG